MQYHGVPIKYFPQIKIIDELSCGIAGPRVRTGSDSFRAGPQGRSSVARASGRAVPISGFRAEHLHLQSDDCGLLPLS